jgi:ligand-binding sensor domain-containing protein
MARSWKRWLRLAGVVAGAVALGAGFVAWRASRALRIASEEVQAERGVRFVVRELAAPQEIRFEPVSAPAVFLQAARFQDHLYIASPAGLLEYDGSGAPLRQFSVGRELPSSPLVALTPGILADSREPELLVATAQEGVLAFNGRSFRQIYLQTAEARDITSILPVASGHLLIGTKKRGVLLYDGKQIAPLHATLGGLYVQALAGSESDLWVGTLNQGVLHWHAGETEAFGEKEGLPDPQVQAIAVAEEKTYVGTVLGVAEFDRGRFARVLAPGVLVTSLLVRGETLMVGSEDQGVVSAQLKGRRSSVNTGGVAEMSEVRQVLDAGDSVYVLTRKALLQMNERGLGWKQVLQPGPALLSDRNVSALAVDGRGRVWVGYFDRGLDLLEAGAGGGRSTHVENEQVFCVNRILPDAKSGTVAVATANGLVRFGETGKQEQVLTPRDGLISDHVTDVVAYRDGLAIATPAGLTFLDANGARSMYAFQGLVNNHVYALGVSGDELLVGTLGGLSKIGQDEIPVNYSSGSSGLKHNWVTAVARVGDEWMVGTYGAGVMGMDGAGHFRSFDTATGEIVVNPGAMLVTPRHVLAGTLGEGLYVFDRETERWTVVKGGLPSLNVTALARSGETIYVGTDNGLARILEEKLQP